jgi:tetratricopeptide (TPR) repeat protein
MLMLMMLLQAASHGWAQGHQHAGDEKLGSVNFATSCKPGAQASFNRAVALLHSFQFSRAIDDFNATLAADPTCGIAYWGIALSDWSNPFAAGSKDKSQLELGRKSAEQGKSVGARTERERAYIAAVAKLYADYENTSQRARLLAYCEAMGEVAASNFKDPEAQIFYALALAASEDPADKTYAARLKAGAILENLFKQEPNHPGLAHYIIHTYDVPALAQQALVAAQRYATIAPDAPHALHMPSHTFTRLGYWQESIDSNLAAAASARRVGQTAEELHASDYEIYAYLQTAQDRAADHIAKSLSEVTTRFDPKVVISGAAGPSAAYFAMAAIPARYALERGDWQQAEKLSVRETPFPYTEAITWFARGLGAARLGHVAAAKDAGQSLQQIRDRLATGNEAYWSRQVEIQQLVVSAYAAFAAGQRQEALKAMQSAAEMEDGTEKSAVTPGPLAPVRELLGEMLIQMNKPNEALEQFEAALKKEPQRFRSLYGAAHAAQLGGKRDLSQEYFRELLQMTARADQPRRPELLEAARAITPN